MTRTRRTQIAAAAIALSALEAYASDLHIQLPGDDSFTGTTASFSCDGNAAKLGLPAGTFPVQYINGAGNSLAVLPIGGKSLIFAGVVSGSGARYAASKYIWSDGGARGAFLSSDLSDKNAMTLCKQAK